MPCSRIRRAASIGCVAGKRLFGCKSPTRRFLSHIQTMADADTWVVVPCCQLLHACEDGGLPTDDGRCRPFKNGGIQDTHRPQGPCHLPAIERLADFHSLASRPFSRLRSHACSCIGTKRTPHEANRPVRLPDSAAERTCALLFLKRRELFFQGFAHCGNASFRAAGNAQAFRLRALSPGCSILPHSLSRLAAAGPDRNGWRTGYFRFSLRSLRFTAICSRRTSVSSSS